MNVKRLRFAHRNGFLLRRNKTKCDQKSTKLLVEVYGFGGIADTEYSVSVETNYSAEYSAETGIRSTTNRIYDLHANCTITSGNIKTKWLT
jgi:hypothetical protein